MSADQAARRMWTLFEPVHALPVPDDPVARLWPAVAAAGPWRDPDFAGRLAKVLGPIALACSAELPALSPVGVPRPQQAGPGADR